LTRAEDAWLYLQFFLLIKSDGFVILVSVAAIASLAMTLKQHQYLI